MLFLNVEVGFLQMARLLRARLRVGSRIIPENFLALRALPFVPEALAYFITFTCYGTRLPGNPKGSISHHSTPLRHSHRWG